MNAYLLLILGLLLVFLEFFLPGAVLGTSGALFLLASIFFFGTTTSSPLYLLLYVLLVVALLVGLVKFALWRIRKSGKEDSFYLQTDQTGFRADQYDASLIGSTGSATTDLRPAGRITVQNQTLQALSQGGFIAKGSRITVIGGEGATLIVKPFIEESPPC